MKIEITYELRELKKDQINKMQRDQTCLFCAFGTFTGSCIAHPPVREECNYGRIGKYFTTTNTKILK